MFRLLCIFIQFITYVSSCPPGWQPGSAVQGKCYLFVNQKQIWQDAENYCRKAAADGHLTSIKNAFENMDIFGKVQHDCAQFWIGLEDIGHTGKFNFWIDGQVVQYTNWDAGQPITGGDKQCVSLNGQTDGRWVTEYSGNTNCFVCESYQSSITTTPSTTTPSTTIPTTTTPTTTTPTTTSPTSMNDCYDWLYTGGARSDGIYQIRIPGLTDPLNVWCDMTTDGGGWTVIQRRVNGDLSFFNKTWHDYKYGFNNGLDKNLWLGNEYIHIISTKDSNVDLRIDVWGDRMPSSQYANSYWWQKQSSFYLDSEANYYTLHASKTLEGNASISEDVYGINYNIGYPFSTIDNNHDGSNGSCTKPPYEFGGWWLGSCTASSLNGIYVPFSWGVGFIWNAHYYSVNPAQSRMMLRKAT